MEAERRILFQPPTIEQPYYLVSFEGDIQRFAEGVRSHWGIENQLHWVLDVAFQEDASYIRKYHAPANLPVVRHVALNLLRQDSPATRLDVCKRDGTMTTSLIYSPLEDTFALTLIRQTYIHEARAL